MEEVARVVTEPEICPYLRDRRSRSELRLLGGIGGEEYAARLGEGFRRFGAVLFRPACEACSACIPLRVAVERFRPSRSQRRVLRRNRATRVEAGPPAVDGERLEVYAAFLKERSERVGWEPREADEDAYRRSFVENIVPTIELRYRVEGRLAAVSYADLSPGALNSIYCYHHPDFHRLSPGTFDVLTQIAMAARLGLRHLYLGYSIAGCRSMEYKARFRPAEVLVGGEWKEQASAE